MTTRNWEGTVDADATDDANWDTVKPVNGDSVVFAVGFNNNCDLNIVGLSLVDMLTSSYTATIDIQQNLTITNDLDLTGATVTGTFTVTCSGTGPATLDGSFPSTATFNITGTYTSSGLAGTVTVD